MHPLIDSRRAEIVELCRQLRVRHLDVFGSVVNGTFDPVSSDVDIIVEFEPMTSGEYVDAYFSLKEGLESVFERAVDLLSHPAIVNPYFRKTVESSRQRIYAA